MSLTIPDIVKDFSRVQATSHALGESNKQFANRIMRLQEELSVARDNLDNNQRVIDTWIELSQEWEIRLNAWRDCAERFSNLIDRMNFGEGFKPINEAQQQYKELRRNNT